MSRSKYKNFLLFITALFLFSFSLLASNFKKEKNVKFPHWAIILKNYISQALESNRELKAKEMEVKAAYCDYLKAKKGYVPMISVEGSYTHLSEAPGFEVGGHFMPLSDKDISLGKVVLNQPLYVGGKIRIGIKLSFLKYQMEKLKLERLKEEVIYKVTTSFFDILKLISLIEVLKDSVKTLEEHHKVVEALYKNGVVLETDLLEVEVRLSQIKQQLVSMENNLRIAKMFFKDLLAVDVKKKLEFPLLEWQQYIKYKFQYPTDLKKEEFIRYFIDLGLKHRKELQQLDLLKKLYQYQSKLEKSSLNPSLFFSGEHHTGTQFEENNAAESYTLALKWDLVDFGKSRKGAQSYKWRKKSVFFQKKDVKNKIKIQIRKDILDVLTQAKTIDIARLAYETSRKNLHIYRYRYKQGIAKNTDLLEAELNFTKSRSDFFSALYAYISGLSKLYYDAGIIYLRYRGKTASRVEEFQKYLEAYLLPIEGNK